MERKSLATFFFFLVLLFAAQEMVVKTEGKTCEKPSKYFSGICIGTNAANQRCGILCRGGEGLLGGTCKDFKCVCTRAC